MQAVTIQPDFDAWRDTARKMLVRSVPPDQLVWSDSNESVNLLPSLFVDRTAGLAASTTLPRVPPTFLANARTVAMHRDPARWSLLYRLLWRLTHGEQHLLQITIDPDVDLLLKMQKHVSRDIHKMHAFVRFRVVTDELGEHFIAWHRPDHLIVPAVGPWFARRFPIMRWTILTPDASVSWDLQQLHYTGGVPASAAPSGDELETLWKTYYGAIFNPARIKTRAMKKEMPVRHWATLPEAEMIDDLLRQATPPVETFMPKANSKPAVQSAVEFVPTSLELTVLKQAATQCKGCELYCNATQVVFGEGPETAGVMFVGEQPGDKEDMAGKPFIGPAGQMLDRGLEEAGIDRGEVYVTNAVKHFKFEQRGTRRIHAKPKRARNVQLVVPGWQQKLRRCVPS